MLSSEDSIKNTAIAAIGGGLTAGAMTALTPSASSSSAIANSANTSERVMNNFTTSFKEVAINTTSSSAAQSAINGDSFTESLENQAQNVLIYTAGKVAANEIGMAANTGEIDKATQLTLHAGLGAGTAALTGNDAVSGAVAGVVGEMVAEGATKGGVDRNTAIQLASLGGAISSVSVGGLTGVDDEKLGDGAWEGSRIGGNAAANNAYFALRPLKSVLWLGPLSNNKLDDITNTEIAHEQLFFEDAQGGNIGFMNDSSLREESGSVLQKYRITQSGFDDGLMREAVKNVQPKPYSLLGIGTCQKYNCQDWAEEVRQEYNRLDKNRR